MSTFLPCVKVLISVCLPYLLVNSQKETLTDMARCKRENPSAIRSKMLLKGALLTLLKQEPLEVITVSQICQQAALTRPTFYNHYSSKEALAVEVIDNVLDGFSEYLEKGQIESTLGMLRAFLDYWESRWELLQLIVDNGLLPMVSSRFESHLAHIFVVSPFTDKHLRAEELTFHNRFLSAGMAGMLECWVGSESKVSAEKVAGYMENMIATISSGME